MSVKKKQACAEKTVREKYQKDEIGIGIGIWIENENENEENEHRQNFKEMQATRLSSETRISKLKKMMKTMKMMKRRRRKR
jgi:hypothetical protein